MRPLLFGLLIIAALVAAPVFAQRTQKFTGVITDSMCSSADHKGMRMGPTDAECTVACVLAHGAQYVLYDGKEVYILSDQTTPEKFAGKKVTVTGTLDAKTKTVHMDNTPASILPAK